MGKASENKLNFIKTSLRNLPMPNKQTYCWDTKVEGLSAGITPKSAKSSCLTTNQPGSSWAGFLRGLLNKPGLVSWNTI